MKIQKQLLTTAVSIFMDRLSSYELKEWIDKGLDMVEDKVEASPNTVDDIIVLPLCKMVRDTFSIPDDDEEVVEEVKELP